MKNLLKDKKVLVATLLGAGVLGYFFKKMHESKIAENVTFDTTGLSKSDIDYNSADGNYGEGINIKKYLDFIRSTPSSDVENQILLGKNIYTLFDNVKVRNDASIDNISKVGVIPKQYTYLGKVSALSNDAIGDLWLEITFNDSNLKISKLFKWGKTKVNPFRRYVKATAVFCKTN